MSGASINKAANDAQLNARVIALAQKEIIFNETLANTQFAKSIQSSTNAPPILMYAVAVAGELAYESALQAGRGAPGHDADIITDGQITSAIVSAWPPDPEPPVT